MTHLNICGISELTYNLPFSSVYRGMVSSTSPLASIRKTVDTNGTQKPAAPYSSAAHNNSSIN